MQPTQALRSICCPAFIALLLSACSPGDGGPPGAGPSAAASSAADGRLAGELEHIERIGRARPAAYEQALRGRAETLLPGDPARLEVTALRGLLAAQAGDAALGNDLERQLLAWPASEQRASAHVAAATAAAEHLSLRGKLSEARKRLAALEPADLAAAAPVYRWRYHLQFAKLDGDAGELDAALSEGYTSLRLAQQLGQHWRMAMSYAALAFTTLRADTPARARQIAEQALAEALKDPDPMTLERVHMMRGIVHVDDADGSITQQAFADGLEQAALAGADSMRALGLANFADYHLRRGRPARALELAEQALPLARATRNLAAETLSRYNIGLAKIALGRVAEGRAEARAAILMDEQQGAAAYTSEDWKEFSGYLERAGDLAGAAAAYREHRRLVDRVLRDETRQALLEAQERQDAEQRARDIELLNRDNALKAEQVQQRNLALALWGTLGGCVLVSLGLLYLAFLRARRTNAALADSNASLKAQTETDPLTGLANRRHFQSALRGLGGSQGLAASFFLVDVDHFKRINDAHGHARGDAVLLDIARRLRQAVRDDDLVVRWGGEEFLIVAPGREGMSAPLLAQRLLDLIGGQPVRWEGDGVRVTASIGFITLPLPPHGLALPWERAIDLVDAALYLAKADGRNRAYGIAQLQARDAEAAAAVAPRLREAWRDGQVSLTALTGPVATGPGIPTSTPTSTAAGPGRPAAA